VTPQHCLSSNECQSGCTPNSTDSSGGSQPLSQAALIVLIIGIIIFFIAVVFSSLYCHRRLRRGTASPSLDTNWNQVFQLLLRLLNQNQSRQETGIADLSRAVDRVDGRMDNLAAIVTNLVERLRAPAPPADIRNPVAPDIDNAFQNALECSICLEILHNPVSVITRDAGNGGCRK
jgi:hypothetical protein